MDKWLALLDRVKTDLQITYDKEMAALLGISPQALHQYKTGDSRMGPVCKLKLLEMDGETELSDALDEIEEGRKRPPKTRHRKIKKPA